MSSIIIVLPKLDDAKRIKDILIRQDFDIRCLCTNGAKCLYELDNLDSGIVICGYKLSDMFYTELLEYLPERFEMLLLVSQKVISNCQGNGVVTVSIPFNASELADTLRMMELAMNKRIKKKKERPKKRSENEIKQIEAAKQLLMERNHMTEEEAHRYIQKCSMDSGTNIVEAAQMIMELLNF